MKKIFYLSLLFLILCGCSSNTNSIDIKKIAPDTVYSEIDNKNIYIIDVREEDEYETGHIKNAYNIPLTKIDKISKMDISLDSKIIVYCQSGNRSKMAATQLLELGYTNIYDMGGINTWNYELIKD